MNRRTAAALLVPAVVLVALYLLPIPQRGLIGPDEPRYASIARHMAESGDWVTPTLWGEPWFEKPALLFWLGGAGHVAGLEAYTRVPVALLCLLFLVFFYRKVAEALDRETGLAAAALLATSAGWVAYADSGVFDAPVSVFTSAALLSLLPGVEGRRRDRLRGLPAFGALLALGVLSKGLVAPIVALFALLPVLWVRPRTLADCLGYRALVPFAAVCLPWYAACYWANGRIFLDEFIIRHHLERFVSSSLQHVQPWWFFLPVLLTFLLPWTPLLVGLRRAALWSEPRLRFLTCWAAGTMVFFSLSVNKLPAYILPVLPPIAVLMAVQWRRSPSRRLLLASGGTLALVPLAGVLLPPALADGIRRAWAALDPGSLGTWMAAGIVLSGLAMLAAVKVRPPWDLPAVALVAAIALVLLKLQVFPQASRIAGTREFAVESGGRLEQACLGDIRRHVAYGLRHHTAGRLRDCGSDPRPLRVEGDPPRLVQFLPDGDSSADRR